MFKDKLKEPVGNNKLLVKLYAHYFAFGRNWYLSVIPAAFKQRYFAENNRILLILFSFVIKPTHASS